LYFTEKPSLTSCLCQPVLSNRVIQASGRSRSQACLPSADLESWELVLPYNSCWHQPPKALKRVGGGGTLTAVSGASQEGLYLDQPLNGWTGPVFFPVSVVLAVILLVAHRRMAAQMAAATSGTSQGVRSPNSATVCVRLCQGPMLLQPELKGDFNPGSWGLVALLSSLNPLHRSRTQSCFTFY
jgi:hypothetical protein